MSARSLVSAVAVAVLSLAALGCHHGSSPSEPARRDALSMVSISPAEGTVLPYGSTRVDVTIRVHYSFANAARGTVGLLAYPGIAQLPTGLPVFAAPFSFPVDGQEGEATLHSTLFFDLSDPLPKNSRITLNFALFPEGVTRTTIGFDAHYQLGS
jgi:hypothetical protein